MSVESECSAEVRPLPYAVDRAPDALLAIALAHRSVDCGEHAGQGVHRRIPMGQPGGHDRGMARGPELKKP